MQLTQEQLDKFDKDGCLAIEGFLSKETVAELNNEIENLYKTIELKTHPLTKFTTENDGEHVGDDYFLNSSDKISFFFEVDAFEDGELVKPLDKAINKIGHGLHFLNKKFYDVTVNDEIKTIAKQLGFKDPRAVQSMVIVKQPEIGGVVPSHTDAEFLYTNPVSCKGFWFALQDCTLTNGCLSYYPGSHKKYPLTKRFVKDVKKGSGTKFINLADGSDYDPETDETKQDKSDPKNFVSVEIPAGSLVLIHGTVLHKSERNTSLGSRNAYTFHVVEGGAEYDDLNWLQMPPDKPSGTANFEKLS
ncbi:unnamed protein product [Ambrosiozyma monospora]|uniref:Unnamed protein product n=1 Tax=Ambrosiozyma monospora TaxID=43982 RepID=A0ACB5T877_AMBMO|nr:unnamed protein product [Ambrosiozyma monospora]